MLANSFCKDSDSADSGNRRYFRNFCVLHSSQRLREGARPEVGRYNIGHANIAVTQNVYAELVGRTSGWGHPSCRSRNQRRSKCRDRKRKRISLSPSATAVGFRLQVAIEESLVPRIRHCVECPNCHILYLVSLSPYRNGSYLMPTMRGSSREYALYCSCRRGSTARVWRWSEVKACEISKAAYDRGYGTREEVVSIDTRPPNV
jgi:hypothetical protein